MLKKIICLIVLILSASTLFSCSFIESVTPTDKDKNVLTNVVAIENLNIKYGDSDLNTLDIFLPEIMNVNATPRPAILMIHGGSWTGGSKEEFYFLVESVLDYGYIGITMNYDFISETHSCFDILKDIDKAMAYIKNNGQNYGIDTSKIAVVGASAGAHLAMLYAYKCDSPIDISFIIDMVGPSDFTDPNYLTLMNEDKEYYFNLMHMFSGADYTEGEIPDAWAQLSPITYVDSSVPPTLLAYGKIDNLVPYSNAESLYAKLQSCNVVSNLVTFDNSGHDLNNDADKTEILCEYMINGLNTYLPINI